MLTVLVFDEILDNVSYESLRARVVALENDEIADDLLVFRVQRLDVVVHGRLSRERSARGGSASEIVDL